MNGQFCFVVVAQHSDANYKRCRENILKDTKKGRKNIKELKYKDMGVREMNTSKLIKELREIGIIFDKENFRKQAQNYISACELAKDKYVKKYNLSDVSSDFVFFAIKELWYRILPDRICVEMIDDAMQKGYDYLGNDNYVKGLEMWGNAWRMMIEIVPKSIKSVETADDFLGGLLQIIYNWCQDYELELGNAGIKDDSYHTERIKYCHDFCSRFPDTDENIMVNMLWAEAESTAVIGDTMKSDELFGALVRRFPKNVWCYVGWGDMYSGIFGSKSSVDYERAKKIYRSGLERCSTETEVLIERLDYLEKEKIKLP
ncbi:MAG: hypothetical protein ACYCSO_09865 [Cuniculiplasma sp.]